MLAVTSLIGRIIFLININNQNIIIQIANMFVISIENAIFLTNNDSNELLSLNASRTFQKLSVGIISSIYLGAIPLLTK